jgi:NAD(P)-dependent dehydrogenase (short-subunit alcohol dehydrogenase family)
MHLLVTSASGINGAGYGKLPAFDGSGQLLGPFTEDTRVLDPRGLGAQDRLLFLNSGADRILALDAKGRGAPRASIYAGAKHAVEGITKSVALELATSGIRVNAVAPGLSTPTC